jgi:hypothetical protein
MLAEPEFQRREQTLFLQALYFLSMHERCHVALDHGTQINEMRNLPDEEKAIRRQRLELDADRCALDIINSDEAQFKSSPVSFFGVLLTVATQSIVANQSNLKTDRSHPSARDRISAATDRALAFLAQAGPDAAESYAATLKGTAAYFEGLLERLPASR